MQQSPAGRVLIGFLPILNFESMMESRATARTVDGKTITVSMNSTMSSFYNVWVLQRCVSHVVTDLRCFPTPSNSVGFPVDMPRYRGFLYPFLALWRGDFPELQAIAAIRANFCRTCLCDPTDMHKFSDSCAQRKFKQTQEVIRATLARGSAQLFLAEASLPEQAGCWCILSGFNGVPFFNPFKQLPGDLLHGHKLGLGRHLLVITKCAFEKIFGVKKGTKILDEKFERATSIGSYRRRYNRSQGRSFSDQRRRDGSEMAEAADLLPFILFDTLEEKEHPSKRKARRKPDTLKPKSGISNASAIKSIRALWTVACLYFRFTRWCKDPDPNTGPELIKQVVEAFAAVRICLISFLKHFAYISEFFRCLRSGKREILSFPSCTESYIVLWNSSSLALFLGLIQILTKALIRR